MSISPRLITRVALASSKNVLRVPAVYALQCIAGPSRLPLQPRSYRRYATTLSSQSSSSPDLPPIPPNPNIKVTPPSIEAIKEEGFFEDDVVLVPEEEARLVITPQAVQVSLSPFPLIGKIGDLGWWVAISINNVERTSWCYIRWEISVEGGCW
jgi:hypothetical protein